MRERWLPAPGFEDHYEVSNLGRVRAVRILAQQEHPDGYVQVTLHRDGKSRIVAVHRLVMLAFEGSPPEGMEVLHRNGKRGDARRTNLRYGTKPENRADRERHRGRGTGRTKRSETDEIEEVDGKGFLSDALGETVSPRGAP